MKEKGVYNADIGSESSVLLKSKLMYPYLLR